MSRQPSFAPIKKLAAKLRALPKSLPRDVAAQAAPALQEAATATFVAGTDAYGNAWPAKADGSPATLFNTGALYNSLAAVPRGAAVKLSVTEPHAVFQLGKRPILPTGELPASYAEVLTEASHAAADAALEGVL